MKASETLVFTPSYYYALQASFQGISQMSPLRYAPGEATAKPIEDLGAKRKKPTFKRSNPLLSPSKLLAQINL